MQRRTFLTLAAGAVATSCGPLHLQDGLWNPCPADATPLDLLAEPLLRDAWQDIPARQMWDCHVHLVGTGDTGQGIWNNPQLDSLAHPWQYTQKRFYLNAACIENSTVKDMAYQQRLLRLSTDFPPGAGLLLLAFDYLHDDRGVAQPQHSAFAVADAYAAAVAASAPQRLAWLASVHPYRPDAIDALHWAAEHGAVGIKWLPTAMNIDPAAPRCNRYYDTLRHLHLPLLTHAGDEMAVSTGADNDLGNPLRLRRALDRGVSVIVAHCASLGLGRDLDRPGNAQVANFQLFARLMDQAEYRPLLRGDLAAVTQVNRDDDVLSTLLQRGDWHDRLLQGSDFPLPGILPLVSLGDLTRHQLLDADSAALLSRLRPYNPLLFDFLLKRRLRYAGAAFSATVFHTARHFPRLAQRHRPEPPV